MSEFEQHIGANEEAVRQHNWDIEDVSEHLATATSETLDVAYGEGYQLHVGQEPTQRSVELFPNSGVARITGANARIELFRLAPPQSREGGILFETETKDSRVVVTRTGEVLLALPADPLDAALSLRPRTPVVEERAEEAAPPARAPEPSPL